MKVVVELIGEPLKAQLEQKRQRLWRRARPLVRRYAKTFGLAGISWEVIVCRLPGKTVVAQSTYWPGSDIAKIGLDIRRDHADMDDTIVHEMLHVLHDVLGLRDIQEDYPKAWPAIDRFVERYVTRLSKVWLRKEHE